MQIPARHQTNQPSVKSSPRSGLNRKPVKRTRFHGAGQCLRVSKICQAVAIDQSVKGDAFQYTTSSTDAAFIALCRKAYGNIAGWQSDRDWNDGEETYKGMVEVSRALMKVAACLLLRNFFLPKTRNSLPPALYRRYY